MWPSFLLPGTLRAPRGPYPPFGSQQLTGHLVASLMASVKRWFEKLASSVLGTVGDIDMTIGGSVIVFLGTCFIPGQYLKECGELPTNM